MFKTNGDDYNESKVGGAEDTVIGSTIKIEGDLVSNGGIVVEGEVSGSVKTEAGVRVGEKAKIVADVKAKEAIISGRVQGNIEVKERLILTSSAEVNGDIQASSLEVQAGAIFNGKCSMTEKVVDTKPKESFEQKDKIDE